MLPKTQFRTQPQFPVEIDRSKSFANGLFRCSVANSPFDLSWSKARGVVLTRATRVPSTNNKIGLSTSTNFPLIYPSGSEVLLSTPKLTFLFSVVMPAAGQATAGLFRPDTNSPNFFDCAWSGTAGAFHPRVRLGSPGEVTFFTTPTRYLQANTEYVLALRIVNGVYLDIWWQGVQQLYTATTSSFNPLNQSGFGSVQSGGVHYPVRELQGMWIWDRELSDGELSALTQNPWQVFRPASSARQNIFIEVFKPSSDITVTGWTGSPDNVNLYANIDESTASDTDYVLSPSVSSSPGPAIFGLSPSSLAAGNYTVNLRARRTGSVGQVRALLVNSSGTTVGTSSWQTLTTTYTTYNLAITTTGTAARLRFEVQE